MHARAALQLPRTHPARACRSWPVWPTDGSNLRTTGRFGRFGRPVGLGRQRSDMMRLILSALADGAYANEDVLPGARGSCLAALSVALGRLHARRAEAVDRSGGGREADGGQQSEAAGQADLIVLEASGPPASTATVGPTGLYTADRCRRARARKRALARGARAFGAKPREGLQLLQAEGVLGMGSRLEAREVAAFLRSTPGLDKTSVGSYLGEAGTRPSAAAARSGASPVSSRRAGTSGNAMGDGGMDVSGSRAALASSEAGVKSSRKDPAKTPTVLMVAKEDGPMDHAEVAGGAGLGSMPKDLSGRTGKESRGVEVEGGERRGVYIGDTAEFHAEVLEAFVESFDFRGQQLLGCLRMFLEAFRLPGEAQQIDRILHVSGRIGVILLFS